MKKITYLLFVILIGMSKPASSAMFVVTAQNFVFDPANIQVNVGDTIMWVLGAGTHTTTSTTIPIGATSWDAPVNSANPSFMYQVTVEGEYDYKCSIHVGMGMVGHISVLGASGISSLATSQVKIINNLVQNDLEVKFNSNKNWQLELLSLTGAMVKRFLFFTDANRLETFSLADLPNGIYIVRFSDGQEVRSQRIIKQ